MDKKQLKKLEEARQKIQGLHDWFEQMFFDEVKPIDKIPYLSLKNHTEYCLEKLTEMINNFPNIKD